MRDPITVFAAVQELSSAIDCAHLAFDLARPHLRNLREHFWRALDRLQQTAEEEDDATLLSAAVTEANPHLGMPRHFETHTPHREALGRVYRAHSELIAAVRWERALQRPD